jgi:hypothetical protein
VCDQSCTETFTITTPKSGNGAACEAENGATRQSEIVPCPVDCVGSWSTCEAECDQSCTETFTITTEASNNGTACEAADGDERQSEIVPCPGSCAWGEWSECSAACGGGTQTRSILTPAEPGGAECTGPNSRECNTQACTGDDEDDNPGGGETPVVPVTAAGGGTSPAIIPVTGVDYLPFAGLQTLSMNIGLMLFGVTMVLEGIDRKRSK